MKKFITAVLLVLAPVFCNADGAKIYTRRARIEDFTSKTIKVVLTSDALMQNSLREEVSRRWYLSPFEFCSAQDYEKQKLSTEFYFLRPTVADGITFLTITKGGKPDEANALKRGFDVVSFPVAREKSPSAHEILYMAAYIDILQKYMEKAIVSESKAYIGIKTVDKSAAQGKTPVLEPDESEKIFAGDTPGYVCGVTICSDEEYRGERFCYKIAVTSDTHELCWYHRHKISKRNPAGFLPVDIRAIEILCK